MTIDFHTHPIPRAFRDGLCELGIDPMEEEGFPLPQWSVDSQLSFMDEAEIGFAVLSLPSPHIHNGDHAKSARIARAVNQEMAEIVAWAPERLGFVACLPVPATRESIAEIEMCIEQLGALGVKLPTNCNGAYLGDPTLDPVMEALDRRGALVIIHPNRARQAPKDVVTGTVAALFEYPTDTTRAVLNMVAHNIMVRFPHIRFIIPHCGSFLPYMSGRMAGISKILASMGMMEKTDVTANLSGLYYDIAGDPEPNQLEGLLAITDEEHIVFGSDFPYSPAPVIIEKKRHLEGNPTYQTLLEAAYGANGTELILR